MGRKQQDRGMDRGRDSGARESFYKTVLVRLPGDGYTGESIANTNM
jgi:hypothetical protein